MARQLGSSYVLEDLVGRGATGEVWSALHLPSDTRVAVKLLKPELAEDPELVARFVQERALLLGLDSPHLVKVRDLVVEGNTLAIVMDLVTGTDLRHLLRAGRLPPELAVDLAIQVLDGLETVHRAGVVHRDLKPENILVDQTSSDGPKALITDFGVARLAHGPSLTKVTGLIGTPIYMAPELSERAAPTAAADIYGAGIVLYEMLSGRPPFDASHPMAVLRAHLEEEPAPIPGLPNATRVVLASMLEKQPGDRPSARDARSQLEQARGSVVGLAPLAPAAGDAGDPYATTVPDLGETRLGSRRSNPPRDTPRPTADPTEVIPAVATGVEPSRRAIRGRSREVAAAAIVAVMVLAGGVAFAARGGGGHKGAIATTHTTATTRRTVTSTTVKLGAKTKKGTKKTTATTKPATPTTVPSGGAIAASHNTQSGSRGSSPSASSPSASSPSATAPATSPPATHAKAPPTTAPHPTPTVVIYGPTTVCNGSVVSYSATITNATSWYWQGVDGSRVNSPATSINVTWNVGLGTFRIELRATNAYRYYDDFKTVTVNSC